MKIHVSARFYHILAVYRAFNSSRNNTIIIDLLYNKIIEAQIERKG